MRTLLHKISVKNLTREDIKVVVGEEPVFDCCSHAKPYTCCHASGYQAGCCN